MHDILILGGGFAGVWAALGAAAARRDLLRDRTLRITLLTREPFLAIRPRLYEPEPETLRVPLIELFDSSGVELLLGEATRVDTTAHTVSVTGAAGRSTHTYDRLILAAGSRLRIGDIPGAVEHTFAVDTYREAVALNAHLDTLRDRPPDEARSTAVVVGAGLAGLEVATTMVSRLRSLLEPGAEPRVVLVERGTSVAPDLGPNPRPLVEQALRELGVIVRVGTSVARVDADQVILSTGEQIPTATTVWTAGLAASDLTRQIPGVRDELGRLPTDSYLKVQRLDGVFAAGDVARVMADEAHVAPMSCQYAIPMGERAGHNAVAELGGRPLVRFAPAPYVTCIDLGDWGGLFTQGWDRQVQLTGFWGKSMKETINRRLIYPPAAGHRLTGTDARAERRLSAA